jgi:hypothetical protein
MRPKRHADPYNTGTSGDPDAPDVDMTEYEERARAKLMATLEDGEPEPSEKTIRMYATDLYNEAWDDAEDIS